MNPQTLGTSDGDDTVVGDGDDDTQAGNNGLRGAQKDDVLGLVLQRAAPAKAAPQVKAGAQVRGAGVAAGGADSDGGVLPFTGASILAFLASAGALITGGTVMARRRRS